MKFKWTSKALIPLLIVFLGLIFTFVFIDVRININRGTLNMEESTRPIG